jgi:hypothetical protein
VRQAPILSGIIMPSAVPPYQLGAFVASATEMARLCCDLGYDGLVNVDGMVTIGGAVMINEINGRIGGCSHIHHIVQAIAGRRYGDTLVTLSHSRNTALSIDQAFGLLEEHELAFDAKAGRGVVVTGEDVTATGYLEYLSIAPTREGAARLEADFEGLLGADIEAPSQTGVEHLAKILSHMPAVRRKEADGADHGAPRHGAANKP